MNRNREYVTLALWVAYGLCAFLAGKLDSVFLAIPIGLLGFIAAMRTLNAE
jgi:hypothetical protein